MKVVLAAINEVLFEGEAESVSVPAVTGMLTILPKHMPLITPLAKGTVVVREGGQKPPKEFQITGGVLEVSQEGATIVV